jgi:hypothetical protein
MVAAGCLQSCKALELGLQPVSRVHEKRDEMGGMAALDTPNTMILPKVLGAGSAALVEIGLFHPVDTVAKRLMANTSSAKTAGEIVFRDAANQPMLGKLKSLFPGMQFAVAYKGFQRIYKFGGQVSPT